MIEEGTVRVVVRQPDGPDLLVGLLGAGQWFGEKTLLTGECLGVEQRCLRPRSCAVLSVECTAHG